MAATGAFPDYDADVASAVLDAAGQRLEPLATSAVGRGCSTFVVDEDRDLVYAATKGDADGHGQGVDSFRLDRTTGALTPLGFVEMSVIVFLDLLIVGAAYAALAARARDFFRDAHARRMLDRTAGAMMAGAAVAVAAR